MPCHGMGRCSFRCRAPVRPRLLRWPTGIETVERADHRARAGVQRSRGRSHAAPCEQAQRTVRPCPSVSPSASRSPSSRRSVRCELSLDGFRIVLRLHHQSDHAHDECRQHSLLHAAMSLSATDQPREAGHGALVRATLTAAVSRTSPVDHHDPTDDEEHGNTSPEIKECEVESRITVFAGDEPVAKK